MSIFNDNIGISSNYSYEQFSDDSEDSDEDNSDRKIQMKKIRCTNLFKKKNKKNVIKKIYLKRNKENVRNFLKLGTLKFPLKYKKNCF